MKEIDWANQFAKDLAESILLLLVQKPFEEWPDYAKFAFHYCAERTPTAAEAFKRTLKESNE